MPFYSKSCTRRKTQVVSDPWYQDNDHNLEILSVDAYLWNTDFAESAMRYFLWGYNANVYRNPDESLKIFRSLYF